MTHGAVGKDTVFHDINLKDELWEGKATHQGVCYECAILSLVEWLDRQEGRMQFWDVQHFSHGDKLVPQSLESCADTKDGDFALIH